MGFYFYLNIISICLPRDIDLIYIVFLLNEKYILIHLSIIDMQQFIHKGDLKINKIFLKKIHT